HVQRHLSSLKAGRHLVTSLRALGATTSGLTLGCLTATHTGLCGLGARGGTQVVHLQGAAGTLGRRGSGDRLLCSRLLGPSLLLGVSHVQSTSSTVTRCATVATMPRISGRSSLTAVSPIRLRPSERSVSRWFCLPPMADFFWVTLSCAIMHQPQLPGQP